MSLDNDPYSTKTHEGTIENVGKTAGTLEESSRVGKAAFSEKDFAKNEIGF